MQESNYDILGISEIASKKEIHEAFRRLALLHHADRGGNEEEFKKIKQSYDDLKVGLVTNSNGAIIFKTACHNISFYRHDAVCSSLKFHFAQNF